MGAGRKILIVEDEDVLGENLAEYFRRSGDEVVLAADATGALAALRRFAAEIVVLDLDLRCGAARSVIEAVLRRGICSQRLVLLTSRSEAAPSAPDGWPCARRPLSKPFALASLREAINAPPPPFEPSPLLAGPA